MWKNLQLLLTIVVAIYAFQVDDVKQFVFNGDLVKSDEVLFIVYEEQFADLIPTNLSNTLLQWNLDNDNDDELTTSGSEDSFYVTYVLVVRTERIYHVVDKLMQNYLWENAEDFRSFKFNIFLTSAANKTEIFGYFWNRDVINVFVFEQAEIYGYQPFSAESECGSIIIPIPVRNDYSKPNLADCTLNMSLLANLISPELFYFDPFPIMFPLLMLVERYDLDYVYFAMPREYQENIIFEMNTLKEDMSAKQYDGIIGSFIKEAEYVITFDKKVELSNLVGYDQTMWIVPKPAKISNIQILLKIFSKVIIFFCVTVLIVTILVWILITKIKGEDENSAFGLVSVTAGFGMRTPKQKRLKFMLILYLFYTQHIIYFFQGNLSSKLLIPQFEKRIKTVTDLWESDLTIATTSVFRYGLSLGFISPRYMDKCMSGILIELEYNSCPLLLNKRSIAFANTRLTSSYDETCSHYWNVIEDDFIQKLWVRYIFRRGHYLVPFVNNMINNLWEHGFLARYYNSLKSLGNQMSLPVAPEKLTLAHFQAAYAILLIGFISGVVVFIFEVCYYRKRNLFSTRTRF